MKRKDLCRLKRGACDLRFLLNRGYPRRNSIELVGNRYNLDSDQRHLLHRAIYSAQEASSRRKKLIPPYKLKGKTLGIDGHNVLITLESGFKNKTLISSDDGVIRDIAGLSHRYKVTKQSIEVLEIILQAVKKSKPARVGLFFDEPISKSRELAREANYKLKKFRIKGSAKAVRVPERELIKYKVIATSDSALMDAAGEVIDLAGVLLKKKIKPSILKL